MPCVEQWGIYVWTVTAGERSLNFHVATIQQVAETERRRQR